MDQAKEAKYLQTLQKASDKIKELIKENESLKYKEPIAIIGIGCRYPGGDFFTGRLLAGVAGWC